MRRAIDTTTFALCALVLTAACAATAKGRELQAAEAIIAANNSIKTAVTYGIVTPDEAQKALDISTSAERTLKRSVESRRIGQEDAARALLDAVFDALLEIAAILEKEKAK